MRFSSLVERENGEEANGSVPNASPEVFSVGSKQFFFLGGGG